MSKNSAYEVFMKLFVVSCLLPDRPYFHGLGAPTGDLDGDQDGDRPVQQFSVPSAVLDSEGQPCLPAHEPPTGGVPNEDQRAEGQREQTMLPLQACRSGESKGAGGDGLTMPTDQHATIDDEGAPPGISFDDETEVAPSLLDTATENAEVGSTSVSGQPDETDGFDDDAEPLRRGPEDGAAPLRRSSRLAAQSATQDDSVMGRAVSRARLRNLEHSDAKALLTTRISLDDVIVEAKALSSIALPLVPTREPEFPTPEFGWRALNGPDSDVWAPAMVAELLAMVDKGVFEPCTPPLDAENIVGSKWVFSEKRDENGTFLKPKARLVARGDSQAPHVDYDVDHIYASVVSRPAFRMIFQIAATKRWELHQLDVSNAFLHAHLPDDRVIYMRLPPMPDHPLIRKHFAGTRFVRLRKSLYGLKQAANLWQQCIVDALLSLGFKRNSTDDCVFILRHDDDSILLGLYVDDIITAASSAVIREWFVEQLAKRFDLKHGPALHFLSLRIRRDAKTGDVYADQETYARLILRRAGMANCNPARTPADVGFIKTLSKKQSPTEGYVAGLAEAKRTQLRYRQTAYRRLIGMLLFLCSMTRPDLSFIVSRLAQYSSNPGNAHWIALKRVLRYLAGTCKRGLCFPGVDSCPARPIIGYADASFASEEGRKNRTGIVIFLHGGVIMWSTKKQSHIATSTSNAEYVASSAATKFLLYLRNIYDELFPGDPTTLLLYGDNQSAIRAAKADSLTLGNRHIETHVHFFRQYIQSKDLELEHVATTDMVADILTKPLAAPAIEHLCKMMNMCDP